MSIIKLLVLGAIKRRHAAHGYRIYRDLTEWRVGTWTTVRPGSIYHAISQLEKQGGLQPISGSATQKLGPAKTEYELTPAGHQLFLQLLEEALKGINLVELSAGIAFMEFLPRARVIALLRERAKAQYHVVAFLNTLPTEDTPTTPSKHPELITVWSESYIGAAASTEKLITSIQSGKYIFNNNKEELT